MYNYTKCKFKPFFKIQRQKLIVRFFILLFFCCVSELVHPRRRPRRPVCQRGSERAEGAGAAWTRASQDSLLREARGHALIHSSSKTLSRSTHPWPSAPHDRPSHRGNARVPAASPISFNNYSFVSAPGWSILCVKYNYYCSVLIAVYSSARLLNLDSA